MSNWMEALAVHYEAVRQKHPADRLMLLFDIDGTILDARHAIRFLLQSYDKARSTCFFDELSLEHIASHGGNLENLVADHEEISEPEKAEILRWCLEKQWSLQAIWESHRPLRGVLGVIRWFQLQPLTFVGLNSGRPGWLRSDTLFSLNRLGEEFHVHFSEEMLHMNEGFAPEEVTRSKIHGVYSFQSVGYRVFAAVDSDTRTLKALADIEDFSNILLLHAETLRAPQDTAPALPSGAVSGRSYHWLDLVQPGDGSAMSRVQFVWHGSRERENLRQFLQLDIHWIEITVDRDFVLKEPAFTLEDASECHEDLGEVTLDEVFDWARLSRRGVKLDLKEGGSLLNDVLRRIARHGIADCNLWFNGGIDHLQEKGFRKLVARHPGALLQCPVDFLAPLFATSPNRAKDILEMLCGWGIGRFSIGWRTPDRDLVIEKLGDWKFELNIHDVPDLESFLKAALRLPASLSSGFNYQHAVHARRSKVGAAAAFSEALEGVYAQRQTTDFVEIMFGESQIVPSFKK